MPKGICIALFLCFSGWAGAQPPTEHSVDLSVLSGQAIRNYPDFPDLNSPAILIRGRYASRMSGSKPWHTYYRYPWFGVQVVYSRLGNDGVLGQMAGVMTDFRFPGKSDHRLKLMPVLNIGAAYFTKPYDESSNPENFIIGSHITFLASAALELNYKLNPSLDAFLVGDLVHASNSHFQLPNVGLNMPVFGLGVRYRWAAQADTTNKPDAEEPAVSHKPALNIRLSVGFNEQGDAQGPVNGPKYPIFLGSVFGSLKLSPVNKLKFGFEGWYNTGVYDYIISQEFYEDRERKRSCALSIVVGHELLMGHFGIVTDMGFYLYNKFYQDKLKTTEDQSFREQLKTHIPARLGFQYYLFDATVRHRKNLYGGVYIKSNFGQADFLETGMGFTF